jgi:hypothetical protein
MIIHFLRIEFPQHNDSNPVRESLPSLSVLLSFAFSLCVSYLSNALMPPSPLAYFVHVCIGAFLLLFTFAIMYAFLIVFTRHTLSRLC